MATKQADKLRLENILLIKTITEDERDNVTEIFQMRSASLSRRGAPGFSQSSHAWSFWNAGDVNGLVDPEIFDPLFEKEIRKCVHIGLLCVQEAANRRPSVATVCSMLSSEVADIPEPRRPAFVSRNGVSEAEPSENFDFKASINNVTITDVSGR